LVVKDLARGNGSCAAVLASVNEGTDLLIEVGGSCLSVIVSFSSEALAQFSQYMGLSSETFFVNRSYAVYFMHFMRTWETSPNNQFFLFCIYIKFSL
jgi:hypothetical protein